MTAETRYLSMGMGGRIYCVAGGIIGVYLGVSSLLAGRFTTTTRVAITGTPDTVGLLFQEVNFLSSIDRKNISGWVIPAQSDWNSIQRNSPWVVMVHGDSTNRADVAIGALEIMRDLAALGYSILAFDLRGCGESGDSSGSSGLFEQRDLLGALDYLGRRGVNYQNIGVLGFSLGGAVALMSCAIPGRVAAVVADGSFADLQMMRGLKADRGRWLLSFLSPGIRLMGRILHGIDVAAISPARAVMRSRTPTLLIHGDRDTIIPVSHARLIAKAGVHYTPSLWIVPGAGHVQAYNKHPMEYTSRVSAFFRANLST